MATKKSPNITVHVLDTTRGLPVREIVIELERLVDERQQWKYISSSKTNANGRCDDLIEAESTELSVGRYRIRFNVESYFRSTQTPALYPYIDVVFDIKDSRETYHLPLLLSPFGYSTYRGS